MFCFVLFCFVFFFSFHLRISNLSRLSSNRPTEGVLRKTVRPFYSACLFSSYQKVLQQREWLNELKFMFFLPFRLKFGFKTVGLSTRRWWRQARVRFHRQTCSRPADKCPDRQAAALRWCTRNLTHPTRRKDKCHRSDLHKATSVSATTARASAAAEAATRTTSITTNILATNSNNTINTTTDFTDCRAATTRQRPVRQETCRPREEVTTCRPQAARRPSASGTAYISRTSSRRTWTRVHLTACSRSTRGTKPQITIWTRDSSPKLIRFTTDKATLVLSKNDQTYWNGILLSLAEPNKRVKCFDDLLLCSEPYLQFPVRDSRENVSTKIWLLEGYHLTPDPEPVSRVCSLLLSVI